MLIVSKYKIVEKNLGKKVYTLGLKNHNLSFKIPLFKIE